MFNMCSSFQNKHKIHSFKVLFLQTYKKHTILIQQNTFRARREEKNLK